jgi:hypothetical protein
MTHDTPSWTEDRRSASLLTWAAWIFLLAWAVHTGDHLRRGMDTVTTQVSALGTTAGLLQLVAIAFVLMRQRAAPVLAVAVGVPAAIGIAAVHLLPDWGVWSDSFPDAVENGVTGFSWFAATFEVTGAALFAAAGIYSLLRTRTRTPTRSFR